MAYKDPSQMQIPIYWEVGYSGLQYYSQRSLIYEEQLSALQGIRAVRTYLEMSQNSAVVGAILFAIKMLIRQVRWTVVPPSQNNEDAAAGAFLESCLEDMSMSWEDTISEILSMLIYGWSYHEIVYKRRLGDQDDPRMRSRFNDGLIGWRKLPIRSQETLNDWEFDDSGGIQGMWQLGPPKWELKFIPIEKALLFRTESRKSSPEGVSILRTAYRSWYFSKRLEEIEGIGIERDLAGLPCAWVPPELLNPTATQTEKTILEQIKKIVTNIRRDEQEGVVFPLVYDDNGNKRYDLTLLTTGGRRQFDTDTVIKRYEQQIAMSVMADILLMGTADRTGSYSLSSNKKDLFATAIQTWLDSIAVVFNRYAIPRLFKINGFKQQKLPQLTHGDILVPDLKELSEFISNLAGVGFDFQDSNVEDYLRQAAHLPIKANGTL